MNIEEIYQDSKPLVIGDCEFGPQIDDIIYSGKIKDEIKDVASNTTNIIVTKYADCSSDILDVEPTLDLDNKEKIIKVELLSSNVHHKTNFTALLNGTLIKKSNKKKLDDTENKKLTHTSVKKRIKQECSFQRDYIKNIDLVSNCNFSESQSEQLSVSSDCNRQFSSKTPLKKHLSACKDSFGAALCSKCGKHFSSNYNLKRHMTSCKLCPDNEKSPRYMCQCGRTYSQEWDMKKHKLKCKDGKKKCKHCLVSNCNLLFYHKAQLIAHMKKDHNMIIQDPKVLNFNSFDEFLIWKEREEEETFTYYSKQTGSNVSGVSVNTYYVCQHDGSDRTHTSTPRKTERRNKKGRIKTGRLCWSQMNVKQFKDGTVKVTYFPSHTHPVSIADTEHHPLPSSITMEIKRRFSEISKLNENVDPLPDENQELKKGRRKRYGVSIRTLRALARKNRSLFRITAEAMQKSEGCKDTLDDRTNLQFSLNKGVASATPNGIQLSIPNNGEENVDDPEPIQIFNVQNSNVTRDTDETLLEDCISYLNEVKSHLLGGKLPQTVVLQVKESLKSMCDLWKEGINETTTPAALTKAGALNDCQEVMMYRPQSPLPVTEIFPMQEEVNTNIEVDSNLKHLEAPEKAVYQIIAVDGEAKTSNDSLYQNAEMIGPREFIIIAADHAQLFQNIDADIQFGLS